MRKRLITILLLLGTLYFLTGCGKSQSKTELSALTTEPSEQETTVNTITELIFTEPIETEATEPGRILPELQNPENEDFVAVTDYIPSIFTELKYATEDNFTDSRIYDFTDVYLRYGTVLKLKAVSEELEEQGLFLKIWDGFRPVSAQFTLWEAYPDPVYVANPNNGFGAHTRGNTVDISLVDSMGREVEMPTGFDDFSKLADRDYSDCTPEATENALLLQTVMEKHGFNGYWGEWWHYSDKDPYDVETVFDPAAISWWYADCQEFISLRTKPDVKAECSIRISAGEIMLLLGYDEGFALVDYEGLRGYVLLDFISPIT